MAREASFTLATQTWTTLAAGTVSEWRTYAATQKVRNPISGKYRVRTARNVFVGRFAKLLQVSASSALPAIPTENLVAPRIGVSVQSSTGTLSFVGTASSPANLRLEAQIQRLPSRNALPSADGYRTAMIGALVAADGDELDVPVAPGYYACAYNWVDATTGMETPLVPLGTFAVALAVETGGATEAEDQKKAA